MTDLKLSKHLTCQMCGAPAGTALGHPPQSHCRVCGARFSPNAMVALEMEISIRKLRIISATNSQLLEASSQIYEFRGSEYTADINRLSEIIDEAANLCNKLLNESYLEVLVAKESEK
jgi:hypothetical protein